MAKHIAELIINSAHTHITNVNKCLKNSKSDIVIDFICITNNGIIITTNKPANDLNLSTIEKYLKSIQNINSDLIESPRLPKSKLYMKIIGLPYKIEQNVISLTISRTFLKKPIFSKMTCWPQNLMLSKCLQNQTGSGLGGL